MFSGPRQYASRFIQICHIMAYHYTALVISSQVMGKTISSTHVAPTHKKKIHMDPEHHRKFITSIGSLL